MSTLLNPLKAITNVERERNLYSIVLGKHIAIGEVSNPNFRIQVSFFSRKNSYTHQVLECKNFAGVNIINMRAGDKCGANNRIIKVNVCKFGMNWRYAENRENRNSIEMIVLLATFPVRHTCTNIE